VKEKATKKTAKVKFQAKQDKMRTAENMQKQKRVLKDPAAKKLRKQERSAARAVRVTTQHLSRVTRRMNRRAKYAIRQMRAHVVDRIREQEDVASKTVKQYAKKHGIKTVPVVHFHLPDALNDSKDEDDKDDDDKDDDKDDDDTYVPLRYSNEQMVDAARAAFPAGAASEAASAAATEVAQEETPVHELAQNPMSAKAQGIYDTVLAAAKPVGEFPVKVQGFAATGIELLQDDADVDTSEQTPSSSKADAIYQSVLAAAKPVGDFQVEVPGYHTEQQAREEAGSELIQDPESEADTENADEHTASSSKADADVDTSEQTPSSSKADAIYQSVLAAAKPVGDFQVEVPGYHTEQRQGRSRL